MPNNSKNDKDGLFTMIPDELLSKYDYKHLILLSQIARLSFTVGYCSASNDYLFKRIHKLTRSKLNTSLDWLEDNGLIVRYNQLNMVNGDFLRTKRLIVLSRYSYDIYQSVNAKAGNKMHEPIECPKGFLLHAEYLKRTKGKQKSTSSNRNKHKKKRLNENNQDITNNTNNDLKALKQPKNDDNKQSKSTLSKEVRDNKFIQLCNYYQSRGADNYVEKATKKLKEYEERLAIRSD